MAIAEHVTLGLTSRHSDKQYRITVTEQSDGTFSVIAHYGRRGRLSATSTIVTNVTLHTAIKEARKTEAGKIKKGYAVETQSQGWATLSIGSKAMPTPVAPAVPVGMSQVERDLASAQTEWF